MGRQIDELAKMMRSVQAFHLPMPKPRANDWLASYKEPGQTFAQYRVSRPTLPGGGNRRIYIRPLGQFTVSQRKIVAITREGLEAFFGMPVTMLSGIPLRDIPANAGRVHPVYGGRQIRTGYLMDRFLSPDLPADAHALLAFIASDLYPNDTMNFVFGQASLNARVGVWSLYRLGNPDDGGAAFRLALLRTLKLATHETGHTFSARHCTKYLCGMNGSNTLDETDRCPFDFCPECMAKISWAANYDPRVRYERLTNFCRKYRLVSEQRIFDSKHRAVRSLPWTASAG
jgi:archaemetzincin